MGNQAASCECWGGARTANGVDRKKSAEGKNQVVAESKQVLSSNGPSGIEQVSADANDMPVRTISFKGGKGGDKMCKKYSIKSVELNKALTIFNIDLHDDSNRRDSIQSYYKLCKDHCDLHVTTSCFTVWRKNKKTNGFAKVIPALADGKDLDGEACRIFFFDDNLEWEGSEKSTGICNLRDVATGEFVDFGEGRNGFTSEHAARHTSIMHSNKYSTVLVKANILDAIADRGYFSKIVQRFTKPEEKIIVYMDVNSTIVCNDSVQSKDLAGTLMSTMYEFVEFVPPEGMTLEWEGHLPIRIEKAISLKQVVKDMTAGNHPAYSAFWTKATCGSLVRHLASVGTIRWSGEDSSLTIDSFENMFDEYMGRLEQDIDKDGITSSWFQVFADLKGEHSVILNSFGVDTRRVVLATVSDERNVMQVAVNHEQWDARDVKKFQEQF